MTTKNQGEEYDERLHQLERKGLSLPKGSGGVRAVSQVDANLHVTDAKRFYGDNGHVWDMLPRSEPRRSVTASRLFQA